MIDATKIPRRFRRSFPSFWPGIFRISARNPLLVTFRARRNKNNLRCSFGSWRESSKIFGNFKVNQGWCHQPVLELVWTGLRTARCDTTYVSWGSVRNTLHCSSSSRSTTTASPLLHLRYYADTSSSRSRQQQRFTTDDFDLGRVRVQLRPPVYEA